jgi:hypothetical protein
VVLPLGKENECLPAMPSGMVIIPLFSAELMTSYPVTSKFEKASFRQTRGGRHGSSR